MQDTELIIANRISGSLKNIKILFTVEICSTLIEREL